MSGGSYDYFYIKLKDFSSEIRHQDNNPYRAWIANLLDLCSEAAHAIEWVDSCDYGTGDEIEPIKKVMEFCGVVPEVSVKAHKYDKIKEQIEKYLV